MAPLPAEPLVCPVCGAEAPPGKARVSFVFLGQTYRFCCHRCRDLFARRPEPFVVHLAHEPQPHLHEPCPRSAHPNRKRTR